LHLLKVTHEQLPPKLRRLAKYWAFVSFTAGWSTAGRRNVGRCANKRHCQTTLALKGNIKVSFTRCPGFL